MAQTFYAVERLDSPFRTIAERLMLLPGEGRPVHTGMRKLVLILGGSCLHSFPGEESCLLETGDMLSVPCRARQFYQPETEGENSRLHNIVLLFDPVLLPLKEGPPSAKQDEDFEAGTTAEFIERYFANNIHYKSILNAQALESVAQIRHEAGLRLPGYRLRISGLCSQLIVQLARNMGNGETAPIFDGPPRGIFLVSCAKEYLLQNLAQEVHLQDVADYLQVSSGHLARTFKQVAGQSLFAYFRQLRLEQAKLRLLDTQQTVTSIAQDCGFSSTTLFCRNFKEYTGSTPLGYRDEFGVRGEA